ncbi:MAG: hypothetical protein GW949_03845 [Spirochaetales bacterium]|nr:hypothetical protein [Spirochaetales bacterium]
MKYKFGIIIVLVLSSCVATLDNEASKIASQEIIERLIDSPDLARYATLEVADDKNVSIYDDYVAFHLFSDQQFLNKGIRVEIAVDYPFVPGDTIVYEWEFRIPLGFVSDAPLNRWWVVAQWHDQPDPRIGETWENFPSNSPPVAFYIGDIDGQLYLSPEYLGYEPGMERLVPIQLGEWIPMRVELHWSETESGVMRVQVGGKNARELSFSGRNMLNKYQHYLKLGMYRHPGISTDNSIHLRGISIQEM